MKTENLIASLSRQIAARGLDPLDAEQLRLLRSNDPADEPERIGMLEDLRDRVGLEISPGN